MNNLEITDKEALDILKSVKPLSENLANVFVKETVIYPVLVTNGKEAPSTEIRTFVRAGEYCSERQATIAAELKSKYADLNKEYQKSLAARGLPTVAKEYPLRATPMV